MSDDTLAIEDTEEDEEDVEDLEDEENEDEDDDSDEDGGWWYPLKTWLMLL